MILVFGGTTEGRIAARVLDESGNVFYYSTSSESQKMDLRHGVHIIGEMGFDSIKRFCLDASIELIIDAAHPFAENLHNNLSVVSDEIQVPVIRFERIYSQKDKNLVWCKDFNEVTQYLEENNIDDLLVLTGVKSIEKLRRYWEKHNCWFRIIDRYESNQIVESSGFDLNKIVYWDKEQDELELLKKLKPRAMLTKESGESGYFGRKVDAAKAYNIPVIVISKPEVPDNFFIVTGEYGLRYKVGVLAPGFFPLRIGFTTGSCATAASKAALRALISKQIQNEVVITLPIGEEVNFSIKECILSEDYCTCSVVKDGGDDPDVTSGSVVSSTIKFNNEQEILFFAGKGVGKVTLPGLGVEVGGAAINPTPRYMIKKELDDVLAEYGIRCGLDVTISVSNGDDLASKTFNPRLGIVGGISIIGTSGVVRPFSNEAFINTIRKEIQVAKAMGNKHLVINSGAKSENILKEKYSNLPSHSFVHYGNYIGETLKIINEEKIMQVTMGIMIGKAVKLAEGHLDTHSRSVVMNKDFIVDVAERCHMPQMLIDEISNITLARELWGLLGDYSYFFEEIRERCYEVCKPLIPFTSLEIILVRE